MANTNSIIIVGGGLAGLFCALKLAPQPVTVLTATPLGEGASAWAQGGIAAAIGEGDTADDHAADTIACGAGIVDEKIAHLLASEASDRIHDLLEYGVPFDRDLEGKLKLSREAAHRARRIVRVGGDLAGKAIMEALAATVRTSRHIRVVTGWSLTGLEAKNGRVTGVTGRDASGRTVTLPAAAVVLATGGTGHLYSVTTNPIGARGDGLAAAARAGAVIADPEFVQFHPTGIAIGKDPAPLASEAIRGDGALLINGRGERFMPALHPDAELGPRDVVARGVFAEIAAGRGAFLDVRPLGAKLPDLFPTLYANCIAAGIDPVKEPVPVAPAAHYHMGGVLTDKNGRTSIEGLWACGEVASTGAHGANRLASNSLLEAVVFAARIAEDLKGREAAPLKAELMEGSVEPKPDTPAMRQLREMMSRHVGVLRDGDGLKRALSYLRDIDRDATAPIKLRNMAQTGLLIAAAAYQRHESRGAQARLDYPDTDPKLAKRTFITLEDARRIAAEATERTVEAAL
ncbi:L-aspartate oxidase [Terrihabitans soli]|uniref:L-aspartate oxidase n=1 Tax=Terrihabitans soli TaxID=708113 RepID=A0A6S6QV79_9HYPH|nr:L-aspartate oxidase [Terrihabitans soli]BCJ90890.1 L-aspartate oxidase [Terrihabitans soli]